MGGAIARGLSATDAFERIAVSDINKAALQKLQDYSYSDKIEAAGSNISAVKDADVVLLAVKPWLVESVVAEIKSELDYGNLILISIAATVKFEQLAAWLDKDGHLPALFRLIPNTAIDVSQSVNTVCKFNGNEQQTAYVLDLFGKLGKTFLVSEQQIGAFMALSSCGIAYAFRYIRAAMEGGVEMGFRYIRAAMEGGVEMGIYPEVAKQVVMQTLKGSVALLEKNNSHPEVEIDKVTTPGGITIKGLNEMEAEGFTNSVIKGLKASLVD